MIELFTNIDVDDLERAVEFYTRALGLKVGRRLEAFAAVEILRRTARYPRLCGLGWIASCHRRDQSFLMSPVTPATKIALSSHPAKIWSHR